MAKIPMGNFGQTVAQPRQAASVSPDAFGAAEGRAMAELGQVGTQFAIQQIAAQKRLDDEERDAKLSSEAADAALAFEADVKTKSQRLLDVAQSGQIDESAAREMLSDEVGRIRENTVGKLPQSKFARGALEHAAKVQMQVGLQVDDALRRGDQQRFAVQATSSLDSLGKLVGTPGEPLESVLGKADAVYPALAARAGIPPVQAAKTLQDWKDNARYQRARMDLDAGRRDPAALDAFMQRLDKGDLVGTLDPDKRAVLIKEAESYRWQAQQAAEHDADKRDKVADRAIASATKQIEAAVPLSLEAWDDLRAKVTGTSRAGEFNALVTQERETQQVLRMPVVKQEQYVQQRETKLAQQGGTMADKGNLQRIKTAIETNRKEIEQAPLIAAQRLYGKQTQPLDIADLVAPGGAQRAAALFADRAVTLQAMAKQFGVPVGEKPLLPQEKDILVQALDKASPQQATSLFGALRAAIDDDEVYRAAMQQMAPDSPVRARAGVLAAAGQSITLEENLIADDVRVPSARVAGTVLAGERIVNATKRQRTEDGKASSLFVPSREAFATAFADKVKNLYRGRPGAQDADLQTAFAYYVGKAAELGQAADGSNIDSKLASEAVTATLGALVDFNGRGTVKAPLGMTADDFRSRMSEKFAELVKDQQLPASVLGFYSHYGAANYRRDGTYVLTLGDAPVVNPSTGQPVVIDLAPVPLSGSPYRSATDLIPGQPGRPGQRESR